MDGATQQLITNPVLIVGTGALATLFAARLSAYGVGVAMLGSWQAALDELGKNGAKITLEDDSVIKGMVQAMSDPSTLSGVRVAIVLVKAWQTENAARALTKCLAADGVALSLQNGLGNVETLARFLGRKRVAAGVTTLGATLLGPGNVSQRGDGPISIEAHPRIGLVRSLLQGANFRVEVVTNLDALLWGKLVVNTAINPLTALLNVPNGVLLERPSAKTLLGGLAHETANVAAALGVALPFADPIAAAESVAWRTAANTSSMLQDVQRGRQTEIDAICGAVVQAGVAVGAATPLNQTMWQLVRALHS